MPDDDLGTPDIRRHIAYVEQETPVIPETIRENLAFAAPDAGEARIREVLDRLHLGDDVAAMTEGLDTPLSETGVSGGQRQRVALTRALHVEPRVLLLDEATAQVDGLTEAGQTPASTASRPAWVRFAHSSFTSMRDT